MTKYRAQAQATEGGGKAMMLKEAERRALAEDQERAIVGLTAATDELATATARVEELVRRTGVLNSLRLALVVHRVGRVRSRGNACRRELEEVARREVELFEEARVEMGDRWGKGFHDVASWGHLEAWQRWFEDLDGRHRWIVHAAGGVLMDHPGHDPYAAEEERRRQVEEYGIHDPDRWGPNLDVPAYHPAATYPEG